jgi:hypothetical protein
METSAPKRLLSEEEKKHASFRAPKGSLDPMWRGRKKGMQFCQSSLSREAH